ncbi:hypothetical protein DB29_03129 [Shouchella clausii]|nr:hypothetical protein DB29_03129 [Shouchella clausii]
MDDCTHIDANSTFTAERELERKITVSMMGLSILLIISEMYVFA